MDSENIDPLVFFGSNKKAKAFDFGNTKLSKAPMFALTPTNAPSKRVEVSQIAGQKRKGEDDLSTTSSKRQEPSSAPAPAGRSPKSKHKGLLSRRRFSANPFTRVDPPTFAQNGSLPFSIDSALAGTANGLKTKSKTKASSKGWHFNIHEDTQDDEMANLMEHSTSTLDISDDEGHGSPTKGDRDNKENIAPADYQQGGNSPSSRRDLMTDEVRSPLGDLNAKDYYAAGCDASSIFVVHTDEVGHEDETSDPSPTLARSTADWEALVRDANTDAYLEDPSCNAEAPEIQIWESESAKADEDASALDDLASTDAALEATCA